MAKRKVDLSLLQGLVEGSQEQEIQKGTPRTTDPNFPVFSTPVNQDILVYIPKTNLVSTENGDIMNVLKSHIHDAKNGKSFVSLRCINGLSGNQVFDALGYDGVCPACEAVGEAWDLYNLKMKSEAARLGIDPQNDTANTLKPVRERILGEMDIKGAEEYVTFPIVIIPLAGKMQPAADALEKLQVVFVHWRKKRYDDTILSALDSLMVNPGHPAGLFWQWKFSYSTDGKPATAMLSAKNAKYTIIQDANAMQQWAPIAQAAEAKAASFTLLKAAEVVVATQFMYKEDLTVEVNKVMTKTRQMIELSNQGGVPALGAGQAVGALPGANPLANFGVAPDQGQATLGGAPTNLGGAPVGNPVQFGQQ